MAEGYLYRVISSLFQMKWMEDSVPHSVYHKVPRHVPLLVRRQVTQRHFGQMTSSRIIPYVLACSWVLDQYSSYLTKLSPIRWIFYGHGAIFAPDDEIHPLATRQNRPAMHEASEVGAFGRGGSSTEWMFNNHSHHFINLSTCTLISSHLISALSVLCSSEPSSLLVRLRSRGNFLL